MILDIFSVSFLWCNVSLKVSYICYHVKIVAFEFFLAFHGAVSSNIIFNLNIIKKRNHQNPNNLDMIFQVLITILNTQTGNENREH